MYSGRMCVETERSVFLEDLENWKFPLCITSATFSYLQRVLFNRRQEHAALVTTCFQLNIQTRPFHLKIKLILALIFMKNFRSGQADKIEQTINAT